MRMISLFAAFLFMILQFESRKMLETDCFGTLLPYPPHIFVLIEFCYFYE